MIVNFTKSKSECQFTNIEKMQNSKGKIMKGNIDRFWLYKWFNFFTQKSTINKLNDKGLISSVCKDLIGLKKEKKVFQHKSRQGTCERLLLNDKTPGFLASRGDEFNPGPETRLDRSELLCNKVLLKYKGDRESFWHRASEGGIKSTPLLVFSWMLYSH